MILDFDIQSHLTVQSQLHNDLFEAVSSGHGQWAWKHLIEHVLVRVRKSYD